MLWKLSLGLFLCVWLYSHNERLQSAASFLCLQKQVLFFCILSITHFSVANLVCPVPEDVCGDTAFAEVCRPARGGEHLPCGAPAIRTDARVSFVLLFMTLGGLSLFCAPERLPDGTGRAASA